MRSFDPNRVGELETRAWVTYYRHQWARFLWAAFGLTREAFQLSTLETVRGGWLVLRANQVWAPVPDNDPDAARAYMRRFYELVARRHRESFDPVRAAELEVEWWHAHRELQRHSNSDDDRELVRALSATYGYVYSVPEESVEDAATLRASAMRHSDRWVAEGCDPRSPLIDQERDDLVRSYSSLLAAVATPSESV